MKMVTSKQRCIFFKFLMVFTVNHDFYFQNHIIPLLFKKRQITDCNTSLINCQLFTNGLHYYQYTSVKYRKTQII